MGHRFRTILAISIMMGADRKADPMILSAGDQELGKWDIISDQSYQFRS